MADIFSDLSSLGLGNVEETDIYKKNDLPTSDAKANEKPIQSIFFDSKIDCPVCNRPVPFKAVRSGQLKLERTDTDLRPIYDLFDPSLYDVLVCSNCGYAALKRHFSLVSPSKQKLIKEKVSNQFKGKQYSENISYEEAIEKYKLALYDAVVMESKDSHKAYLCLKIAWLYRGYLEGLQKDTSTDNDVKILYLQNSEKIFMRNVVDGFKMAVEKESFPVMELSEITVRYIIGDLYRRLGDFDEALKWIGFVIVSKDAGNRLKERARECKELINKRKSAN
ncbi:MAG: DUF2225 domain-containing protein [Vallitaleaceae bacterium]|nr:DUF2225 domain-containing protein [Vallitaleaceae bacterium]